MNDILKKLLPNSLKRKLRKLVRRALLHQNINCKPSLQQKRVLVSYLTSSLENPLDSLLTHPNHLESLAIIKSLIDLDFVIDVAYCLDETNLDLIEQKDYDIIFGFGKPFLSYGRKHPESLKIIYLTEASPDFSEKKEKERDEYLFKRHGKHMLIKRTGVYLTNKQLSIANAGILIGNNYIKPTYEGMINRIETIFPTALVNANFKPFKKDHTKSRKNFVWFGSNGAVHKGLDILVDVFADNPDLNLFVCGLKGVERRLFKFSRYPNIHDLGFVNVNSDKFLSLVKKSSFVIFPSCSEGMSTSVITCMYHGMIPIVTKEVGIDEEDFTFILKDFHVEYISKVVRRCSEIPAERLAEISQDVLHYSQERFTIKAFEDNFSRAFTSIVKSLRPEYIRDVAK